MAQQEQQDFPVSTRRHSAAHVLAQAIRSKYPNANLAIGPDIDNGFYYDVVTDPIITDEDLKDIEKRMKEIVKQKQRFEQYDMPLEEGIKYLEQGDQTFKIEMARDFERDKGLTSLSFYRNVKKSKEGDQEAFVDMCDGPHVNHTGQIGHFKLTSVAGAYWRGDAKREQLTRVYGWLFETREELLAYDKMMQEAKKRDHRLLGQKLELFTTSPKVGSGLIFWLPRGNTIKEQLENWGKETEEKHGYVRVTTPVLTKEELFYTSEHLPHYKDSMFPPLEMDNENYYIKPMNCPFHHTIFGLRPRSYRELPLRMAEYGLCHRYEDSGALFGLMRVRGMAMNDAHIYCTEEQAVEEFASVIKLHEYYYKSLGITDYWMELALRNPENDKYHGDESMWQKAEDLTRKAMDASGVDYKVENDGAAFYGPKMDFQVKSSIGREFTASTCQLDLFMPEKFDLKYIDKNGETRRPVCIHRSPLGTHERFIGFLIEHFAGAFPLWLSPEQIRILPVSEVHQEYVDNLAQKLRDEGLRVSIEPADDTLGKRIRTATQLKINYMLVIGDKEVEAGNLNARNYFSGEQKTYGVEEFITMLREEIATKAIQELTVKA